jgi:hypothetical protein
MNSIVITHTQLAIKTIVTIIQGVSKKRRPLEINHIVKI